MLHTISRIAKSAEQKEITWGVGGSLLLCFHHLIEKPNDIDILVEERSASQFGDIISNMGSVKRLLEKNHFKPDTFPNIVLRMSI